jgi:competence protein ComEA
VRKTMRLSAIVAICLAAVLGPSLAAAKSPAKAAAPPPAKTATAAAPEVQKVAPVDINTASEADLKALPGIGDAYSKKIIANRPYQKKDQLVSKNVLSQATYDKIKGLIVAKKVAPPATPGANAVK